MYLSVAEKGLCASVVVLLYSKRNARFEQLYTDC